MIVALIAIVTLNEIIWYTLVALRFGSGQARRFYLGAKAWNDRMTGVLGALSMRLLMRHCLIGEI
jgi:hypothetical protein